MSNPYDWLIECPCGYVIHAIDAKNYRGAGGKYLNRDVEQSSLNPPHIEVQCPKCLMWIDSITGELNEL